MIFGVEGKTCTKRATLLQLPVLRSTINRGGSQIKQLIRINYQLLVKIQLDLVRQPCRRVSRRRGLRTRRARVARFV